MALIPIRALLVTKKSFTTIIKLLVCPSHALTLQNKWARVYSENVIMP
jgi:hypothetical protein